MSVPLMIVDAFTDRPFAGNPAGVCLLEGPAPERWMAAVAAEVNLSETAFTWPLGVPGRFGLRWWTPVTEVPLCGHATLAAAWALSAAGNADAGGQLSFETASGELVVRPDGQRRELDFPSYERRELTPAEADALQEVLPVEAGELAAFGPKALAALPDAATVASVVPDVAALAALPHEGLVTTAATDDGYVLRYFAPAVGVAEDPVTGSAQCAAAPFWQQRSARDAFEVEQLSARGGRLRVRVAGDRVRIAGRAVVISEGRLLVDPEG